MPNLQILFWSVLTLTVISASAAAMIACTVDTRQRPAARRLIDSLMQIALLGAGTITALLTSLAETG